MADDDWTAEMVWFQLSQIKKNEIKTIPRFESFFHLPKLIQNILLIEQGKTSRIDLSRLWFMIFTSFSGKHTHTHKMHANTLFTHFSAPLTIYHCKAHIQTSFLWRIFRCVFFIRLAFFPSNFLFHWVAHVVYTIHAYQIKINYLLTLFTWCILRAINHVEVWQRQIIRTGQATVYPMCSNAILSSKKKKHKKKRFPIFIDGLDQQWGIENL